jgi:response regulator RpfG family c-di-GMP phosphodiesterase
MSLSSKQTKGKQQRKTIMICDDEEDVLLIYERILGTIYNVITVSSGEECLVTYAEEKRKGHSIDALLLDYRLGDMFGDEVACKIREMDGTKILLISAYDLGQQVHQDLKAKNCIECELKKPVTRDVLLTRIASIIEPRKYEQEKSTGAELPYPYSSSLLSAYYDKDPNVLFDTIISTMNKQLGESTTNLIFKAIKQVYKKDENMIRTQPAVFDSILRRIVGDTAAQLILNEILRSLGQ